MKNPSGRSDKHTFGHYAAFVTLFLLLGGIFFTITGSLQKQAFRSQAEMLPLGSALPAEATCASKVVKTAETVPENQTANTSNVYATGYRLTGSPLGTYDAGFQSRVTGNFTGTTDEILQWGACKWGFETDTVRAIASALSQWKQTALADCNNQGQIQPETHGCQSVGIMRIKDANIPPTHAGTWPYAKNSTAFNVDYALGVIRACFEGKETSLLSSTNASYGGNDLNGCIGAWHSGAWHDGAAEAFTLSVQNIQATKQWPTTGASAAPNVTSGAQTVPNTPVTPSFFPLAPCPTCTTPSTAPVVISAAAPSLAMPSSSDVMPPANANPSPEGQPCPVTNNSVATDTANHHYKHNGGMSGGMQTIIKFILELLALLLQLFGSGQITSPETLPSPSSEPSPCSSSAIPSQALTPSISPVSN